MSDHRLHIVHIVWSLTFGGAEKMVLNLVTHSANKNIRYSIIIFDPEVALKAEVPKNVELFIVPKRNKLGWHLKKDLAAVLKQLHPDLVHVHLFTSELWGTLAAHSLGLPTIYTEHNTNEEFGLVKTFIKRFVLKNVVYGVACSDAVKTYMQRMLNFHAPIAVIRNGIDLKEFATVPTLNFVAPWRCVIIGRLMEQKGHSIALQALAKIKDLPWQLSIVGDGELKTKLQRQAKRLGINDRIQWLGFRRDIPQLLGEYQVVIVPSLWEGLGVVAEEGMAAGRVVVASQVGGLVEVLEDKKTGFFVSPGDYLALAERLRSCFANSKECERVATQARVVAAQRFSVKQMVAEYETLYQKIVKK